MAVSSSFSYSVLTYITDELTQTSIPVGVVLWSESQGTKIRVAEHTEKIRGLNASAQPFLRLVKGKIQQWVASGSLPYANAALRVGTDEWWRHMSRILVHNVRLSEPRAIDCVDPNQELELLYEAVVGRHMRRSERHKRIDSHLSNALGSLVNELERGHVNGFRGKPVTVKRYKEQGKNLLIVEGVNLAAGDAEHDADALVSKLLRIKEAEKKAAFLVGYLASPNGLNGEAFLVEWIQKKVNAKTFDLVRDKGSFAAEVRGQLTKLA